MCPGGGQVDMSDEHVVPVIRTLGNRRPTLVSLNQLLPHNLDISNLMSLAPSTSLRFAFHLFFSLAPTHAYSRTMKAIQITKYEHPSKLTT